jgi:hypothetical protein
MLQTAKQRSGGAGSCFCEDEENREKGKGENNMTAKHNSNPPRFVPFPSFSLVHPYEVPTTTISALSKSSFSNMWHPQQMTANAARQSIFSETKHNGWEA